MTESFPCESGDEAREIIFNKPGTADTPTDMAKVLLRILSSIVNVDLSTCRFHDIYDDQAAYEKLATKYSAKALYDTTGIIACEHGKFVNRFKEEVMRQVKNCEAQDPYFSRQVNQVTYPHLSMLETEPVSTVKSVLEAVVESAKVLQSCSTELDEIRKKTLCQSLVEGIHWALMDFELYGRQPIKCYVKVCQLESDEVDPEAGTRDLQPFRLYRPVRANDADDGAEIVRHIVSTILKQPVGIPYVRDERQVDLKIVKKFAVHIALPDWHSTDSHSKLKDIVEQKLVEAYERFKEATSSTTEKETLSLPHERHLLQLDLQAILLREILFRNLEVKSYLFLMSVTGLVKHLCDNKARKPDLPVLEIICNASHKSLQDAKNELLKERGGSYWEKGLEEDYYNLFPLHDRHRAPLTTEKLVKNTVHGEGAELVKIMVEACSDVTTLPSYTPEKGEDIPTKRKQIVIKLAVVPLGENRLIAEECLKRVLECIFKEMKHGVEFLENNQETIILTEFNFHLQEVLTERVLAKLDYGAEVLAAFFITLGWVIQKIVCQLPKRGHSLVLNTLHETSYLALESATVDLQKKFGQDVFQTLEDTYEELLTESQ